MSATTLPSHEGLRAWAEAEAHRTRDLCSRSTLIADDARLIAMPKSRRTVKAAAPKPKRQAQ